MGQSVQKIAPTEVCVDIDKSENAAHKFPAFKAGCDLRQHRNEGRMEEILQVKDLCKTFTLSAKQQKMEKTKEKKRKAVDHLTFTAYKGEVFGLLGPNGAGKTTTLRMLASLIKPDSGDAIVDGVSVVEDPEAVRARIGFLTSELKLEDFYTELLFDFFSDLHGVPTEVRDARKKELLRDSVSINLLR